MTDEELIARLRKGDTPMANHYMDEAADRIEQLVATNERLEAALRGRIHWIDGEDHCDCGECEALFAALKGDDHE